MYAETRVDSSQFCFAGHLEGANPNSACAANERERIVADDLRGAREFQADCVIDEGLNCTELVGDAEDHARRVGAIGDKRGVVGHQRELAGNTGAGEGFGDDKLACDVALDAEIAPTIAVVCELGGEGRVLEVLELGAVGIGLGEQLVVYVELQMFAVGPDQRW